jgi:hypothetical protein
MKSMDPGPDVSSHRPNPPQPVCPGCDLTLNNWPNRGYVRGNLQYCCEDCADGFKCSCGDKHLGAVSA